MPRFAASKGQANQDQGGGNTKQGLPPSIGVRASLARLMSRKAFSNPVAAAALARIFDNFDFTGSGIYDIAIEVHPDGDGSFTRLYFIGSFTLSLKDSREILRTHIAAFDIPPPQDVNASSEYTLSNWNPIITGSNIRAITAIAFSTEHVYLGIQSTDSETNAIQRFRNQDGVYEMPNNGFEIANPKAVYTIVLSDDDVFVGADSVYAYNVANGTAKYGTGPRMLNLNSASADVEPSVRSILITGSTLYIGGHFKVMSGLTVTRDGAAAYNFGDATFTINTWQPKIKMHADEADSENYINHIEPKGSNLELYGSFKTNDNTPHLVITVDADGDIQELLRNIQGSGEIQTYYSAPSGDEYLCGNFSIGNDTNIVVVRKIDNNGATTDYKPDVVSKIIFGIAEDPTSPQTIFVGGIGIKPQKLSTTSTILS